MGSYLFLSVKSQIVSLNISEHLTNQRRKAKYSRYLTMNILHPIDTDILLFADKYFVNGQIPSGSCNFTLPAEYKTMAKNKLRKTSNFSSYSLKDYATVLGDIPFQKHTTTGNKKMDIMMHLYQRYYHRIFANTISKPKYKNKDPVTSLYAFIGYELIAYGCHKFKTTELFDKSIMASIKRRTIYRATQFLRSHNQKASESKCYLQGLMLADYLFCLDYVSYINSFISSQRQSANKVCVERIQTPTPQFADLKKAQLETQKYADTILEDKEVDSTKYYALIQIDDNRYEYVRDTEENIGTKAKRVLFKNEKSISLKEFKSKVIRHTILNKTKCKWQKHVLHTQDKEAIRDIVRILN